MLELDGLVVCGGHNSLRTAALLGEAPAALNGLVQQSSTAKGDVLTEQRVASQRQKNFVVMYDYFPGSSAGEVMVASEHRTRLVFAPVPVCTSKPSRGVALSVD